MDLVFCGTPQFAVPTLDALAHAGHNLQLVVCQPDRPSGRGQQVGTSAVKQRASQLGIPVAQPEKIKSNESFRAQLESLTPRAIVVVAYGRILPRWMLDLPPLGALNVHGSLLPKYRGAAPIQWAIAQGERETGVTIIRIDEGLDTGAILLQQKIAIAEDDTAVTLALRLAEIGARLMVETLQRLEQGSLEAIPQDHSQATLAPLLKKDDGRVDFSLPARVIYNRLRGFQPWPGAFTSWRGKNLQIIAATALPAGAELTPQGRIRVLNGRLLAGCGQDTSLEILELQPEGKNRMSAREFINGYRIQGGESLDRR
jgi:methionyl-tRNA formyltransferase